MRFQPGSREGSAILTETETESHRLPEPVLDDLALAQRLRAGDPAAFDRFTESYLPALYRFAASRLRGDRELVRDIVQTTVLKALANIGSFRGEAALLTWLCACCRNEIAMHFRRQKGFEREVPLAEDREPVLAAGTSVPEGAADVLLREERARFVHLALDLLPLHHARALSWKYLDNASVKEIASRLSLAPKAAESLLTRARVAFRRHYDRLIQELEPSTFSGTVSQGNPDHD